MINNLKIILKSVIVLLGIISAAMLTVYSLASHPDFRSPVNPSMPFNLWFIWVMGMMCCSVAGLLIIGEFSASKQYIPSKIKYKIRDNVRAFRDPETGEIRYALIRNLSDTEDYDKFESVMIIPDLTNEEIDYLLEN